MKAAGPQLNGRMIKRQIPLHDSRSYTQKERPALQRMNFNKSGFSKRIGNANLLFCDYRGSGYYNVPTAQETHRCGLARAEERYFGAGTFQPGISPMKLKDDAGQV